MKLGHYYILDSYKQFLVKVIDCRHNEYRLEFKSDHSVGWFSENWDSVKTAREVTDSEAIAWILKR